VKGGRQLLTLLDLAERREREAAAALARLHAALADWRGPPRPKPSPWAPANWPADGDPAALVDRELDRRLAGLRERLPRPGRDLIHGDFFPGNLVWSEGAVAAVIDWYEARTDAPTVELASALWEFARDARREPPRRLQSPPLALAPLPRTFPGELGDPARRARDGVHPSRHE